LLSGLAWRNLTFDWTVFAANLREPQLVLARFVLCSGIRELFWTGCPLGDFMRPGAVLSAGMWNLFKKPPLLVSTAVQLVGRPGEIVRPYLIAIREGVPLSSQLAVWFLERLFDLLVALLIFGYGLSRVKASAGAGWRSAAMGFSDRRRTLSGFCPVSA